MASVIVSNQGCGGARLDQSPPRSHYQLRPDPKPLRLGFSTPQPGMELTKNGHADLMQAINKQRDIALSAIGSSWTQISKANKVEVANVRNLLTQVISQKEIRSAPVNLDTIPRWKIEKNGIFLGFNNAQEKQIFIDRFKGPGLEITSPQNTVVQIGCSNLEDATEKLGSYFGRGFEQRQVDRPPQKDLDLQSLYPTVFEKQLGFSKLFTLETQQLNRLQAIFNNALQKG